MYTQRKCGGRENDIQRRLAFEKKDSINVKIKESDYVIYFLSCVLYSFQYNRINYVSAKPILDRVNNQYILIGNTQVIKQMFVKNIKI